MDFIIDWFGLTTIRELIWLRYRPRATAAGAGGAGKTVNAGLNIPAVEAFGCHIPEVKRFSISHLHFQHLIEIAIEHFTHPAHAKSAATHQSFNRGRVETVRKHFEIRIPLTVRAQVLGEARDGLVRDREQLVEHDSKNSI